MRSCSWYEWQEKHRGHHLPKKLASPVRIVSITFYGKASSTAKMDEAKEGDRWEVKKIPGGSRRPARYVRHGLALCERKRARKTANSGKRPGI